MTSSYQDASGLAKGIVSGVTAVTTWLRPSSKQPRLYLQPVLSFEEVSRGIREDFRRGYLFSGEIEEEIYAGNCTFTDPTLSFQGLDTFVNNIASIRPLVDLFIEDAFVILYSLSPTDSSYVSLQASWRMSGGLRLPWRPRIELQGCTTFKLSPSQGGRIVEYYEVWYTEPLQVLSQIILPAQKPPSRPLDLIKPDSVGSSRTGLQTASLLIDELKADLSASIRSTTSDELTLWQIIERLEFAYSLGSLPESLTLKSYMQSRWKQILGPVSPYYFGGILPPFRSLIQEFFDDINFKNTIEILPGLGTSVSGSLTEISLTVSGNIASHDVEISGSYGRKLETWKVLYQDVDVRILDVSGALQIFRRV